MSSTPRPPLTDRRLRRKDPDRSPPTSSLRIVSELIGRASPLASPVALVGLVFAELLLYGGDRREVALSFAMVQAALAGWLVLSTQAKDARLKLPAKLGPVTGLFAGLVIWISIELTPFPQGMSAAAWSLIGLHGSITLDRFATLVELAKLIGLASVFLAAAILARAWRGGAVALAAIGLGGGLYASWAVSSYFVRAAGAIVTADNRLSATVPSPNVAAAVFAVFAVLGWTQTLLNRPDDASASASDWRMQVSAMLSQGRWRWLLLTAISLWGVVLTSSRGGAVATGVGLVTASLAAWRSERRPEPDGRSSRLAPIMALICAVVVLVGAGPLAGRLTPGAIVATDRLDYASVYLSHLDQAPWLGFGLGAFHRFNTLLVAPTPRMLSWELGAMHNVYLQWLYETGAIGLGLVIACIVAVLIPIVRSIWLRRGRPVVLILAVATSALLAVHGMADMDLQFAGAAALWALVLGLGFGAADADPG